MTLFREPLSQAPPQRDPRLKRRAEPAHVGALLRKWRAAEQVLPLAGPRGREASPGRVGSASQLAPIIDFCVTARAPLASDAVELELHWSRLLLVKSPLASAPETAALQLPLIHLGDARGPHGTGRRRSPHCRERLRDLDHGPCRSSAGPGGEHSGGAGRRD